MLRAAPETERAPGSPTARAFVWPRLPEGRFETGHVTPSGAQRAATDCHVDFKTRFSFIFPGVGDDAALGHGWPRGMARLWKWFPPPPEEALVTLDGSIPDFVPELPNL